MLFLPLIWIALRDGLAGATWGILATQLGLIAAVQLKGSMPTVTTQFQLLMLAVARRPASCSARSSTSAGAPRRRARQRGAPADRRQHRPRRDPDL